MLRDDDDWASVKRVLAVRLDNIGDVIMLAPALRALRTAMPSASLTLLASPAGAQAAQLLPWADATLTYRAPWQEIEPQQGSRAEAGPTLVRSLADGGFDAAFIFTSFIQSPYPPAFAAYEAGIPRRVGQSSEWGGSMLTHLVPPAAPGIHEAERDMSLVEGVGIHCEDRRPEVRVPRSGRAEAERLLRERGIRADEPFVLVAPGASCATRRYPFDRLAEALRRLVAANGMRVLVVGDAREVEPCGMLAERSGCVSLAGATTLASLASLVADAALLVCTDSAAMHLGDALGTPMVVLYSGSDLRSEFAPRQAPAILLGRLTACTPCRRFECPSGLACLQVPPAEIAAAALAMLERHASRSPRREVVHA